MVWEECDEAECLIGKSWDVFDGLVRDLSKPGLVFRGVPPGGEGGRRRDCSDSGCSWCFGAVLKPKTIFERCRECAGTARKTSTKIC